MIARCVDAEISWDGYFIEVKRTFLRVTNDEFAQGNSLAHTLTYLIGGGSKVLALIAETRTARSRILETLAGIEVAIACNVDQHASKNGSHQ